jgi:hypothetical protein
MGKAVSAAPSSGIGKRHLVGKCSPLFVVVQSASSRDVLEGLERFFGCGKVYVNHRHDNHREDLFRSSWGDSQIFGTSSSRSSESTNCGHRSQRTSRSSSGCFVSWEERKHLTVAGLMDIAGIVETMNHRKPSNILRILRDQTPTIS